MTMKHTVLGLTLLFSSLGFTSMALPADNGLITEQSRDL